MSAASDPANRMPGLRILRDLYRSLDNDLVQTFRYVEPADHNLDTYSIEFMRLLQTACTGIDSTFRLWYGFLTREGAESDLPRVDVGDLKFPAYHPLLDKLKIDADQDLLVPRSPGILVTPFRGWKGSEAVPTWWTAHNKTKHELASITFKDATLMNAMHALGGFYLTLNDWETRSQAPVGTNVFKAIF